MASPELQPTTVKEHLKSVLESCSLEQKRDCFEDSGIFLNVTKTPRKYTYLDQEKDSTPTMFAANHYSPAFIRPLRFLKPWETLRTTALALEGSRKLSDRSINWIVKSDAPEKSFFIPIESRLAQHAITFCYDWLDVTNNNGISAPRQCRRILQNGMDLGIYPEGKTSHKLNLPHPGFEGIIKLLCSKEINFQIIPVSIYKQDSWQVTFGRKIDPYRTQGNLVTTTMQAIAQNLPPNLRGYYK